MATINLKMLLESQSLERCPFPIPTGWFFVDYSESLKPGELRNVELFDQEWVLFRTESGQVGLTDPYCPHLGAHIGHGGAVVGEHIRCPFHHWEYDTAGWCRHIPYGKLTPPIVKKQAILRTLPAQERYGLIWAWYHPACEEPSWDLPAIPQLETPGFVEPRRGSWPVNTAIQEIAENGVDFAHLKFLHGAAGIPPAEVNFEDHIIHIDMAGGFTQGADDERAFLILPSGQARKLETSFWNFRRVDVPPGSYIVVPRDATPLNGWVLSEKLLGIFSNLAVSAAALAVIGDSN